jgi:hypothetical protein
MDDIRQWLRDPERQPEAGSFLYMKYGKNRQLKKLFADGRRAEYIQRKLVYELRKIASRQEIDAAEPPSELKDLKKQFGQLKKAHAPSKLKIADNPYIEISKLPEELIDEYERVKAEFPHFAQLHQELKKATTDNKRKNILQEMDEIESRRVSFWAKADAWYKEHIGEPKSPDIGSNNIIKKLFTKAKPKTRKK